MPCWYSMKPDGVRRVLDVAARELGLGEDPAPAEAAGGPPL